MPETDLQVRLQVAKHAAYIAGEELLRELRAKWPVKDREGLVKLGETASRKAMTTFLGQMYPNEAISGRNIADLPNIKNFWVVDPLNGYWNYSSGDLNFTTVLTWMENRKPVLAAVYQPNGEIMYTATLGNGAYMRDRKIVIPTTDKIGDAIVKLSLSDKEERIKLVDSLQNKTKQIKINDSPALDLCSIAYSSCDAYIGRGLAPWDWLAPKLILEEAGGMLTDLNGKDLMLSSTDVVASNGKVHKEILGLIK